MRAVRVLAFALLAAAAAAHGEARTPQPVVPKATAGTQCVADPTFMRRNHGDLMKHQRDDTVRVGARDGAFSLKACVQCHASPATHSVAAAPGDFCVSCHSYAAVKIDCFECHASRPAATGTAAAFHPLVPAGPGAHGALRLAAQLRDVARGSNAP